MSLEVTAYLLALKLCYPKNVHMLRGNHESRSMTEHFTFRQECIDKFDEEVYESFMDLFDSLPLAVDVNGDYLCVHGGISPHLNKSTDIDKINRFVEPPLEGLLCDILWSDPADDGKAKKTKYKQNKVRQCSYEFGLDPLKKVLANNSYISLIRAHQVQVDGYKMHRWGGTNAFPVVITVFSAPCYPNHGPNNYGNKGAVILLEQGKMGIKQYRDVDTPYHLPDDLDLFTWSVPYMFDKVKEIIETVNKRAVAVDKVRDKDLSKKDFHQMFDDELHQRFDKKEFMLRKKWKEMRAKIKCWARFCRILHILRENK